MFKYAKLFLIALLVVGCGQEPEPKPTTPLVIKTSNGDARFAVEVASTPDELQTGLMNRTNLAFNSGMIFNIYPVRPTAMWMKNTKIPLDMIFVAPDGTVSMIRENAQPMSEDLIISRDPVRAVIELNAGQVKRNNIKVGDKVNHMLLNGILDIKTPGAEAKAQPQTPETPKPQAPKADIPVPELSIEAAKATDSDAKTPETVTQPNPAEPAKASAPQTPDPIAKAPETAPEIPAPAPEAPKVPLPAPVME